MQEGQEKAQPAPVVFDLRKLTSGQPPTGPTGEWLVDSPSLHRWGRRVLFYDMFASLGPYELFKFVMAVVIYVLWLGDMRLYKTYATASLNASHSALDSVASNPFLRMLPPPWLVYQIRSAAIMIVFFTFFIESFAACQRIRHVE